MSLLGTAVRLVRQRFAGPPQPVRTAVAGTGDPDERVLAWGERADGGGPATRARTSRTAVPRRVTG